jgi:hypothetical protein
MRPIPGQILKLPFGLRDGVLLHVEDVEQGASCGCACPGCGAPLIARKGNRNVHHFAHSSADCGHGVETALHRAAKEAIEAAGELLLPAVQFTSRSHNRSWTIAEPQLMRPDSVRLESRIGGIVPDIVLTANGRDLLVEVCVTHAVDSNKLAKIRELNLSVVEISIGHLPRDLPIAELSSAVVYGKSNREWLFNAAASRVGATLSRLAHRLPIIQRGAALHVDHCPIEARVWHGKAYANVIDDCINCEFCLDAGLGASGDDSVLCLGHSRISSYAELQARLTDRGPAKPNEEL